MSWDNNGPQRSPDQLLALVRAKANHLRWRRRLGITSGAVVLTAVVFIAVALAGPGGTQPTKVQTLGQGSTSTTGALPDPTVTVSPPTEPSTTTSAPTSTVIPSPPTTHGPVATTLPRATTTTPPTTTAPSTTTTAPWPPVCAPTALALTANADRQGSYPPGQAVDIALSIQNHGALTCYLNRDPGMSILDSTGKMIQGQGVSDLCTFFFLPGPPSCVLAPGQVQHFDMTWSHTGCIPKTVGPCAAGNYTAEAAWGEIKAPPVPIVLS